MTLHEIEIIPAIMPDSAEQLSDEAQHVSGFAHAVQIDVMDGKFVPPVSWPYGNGQMGELEKMQMISNGAQLMYEVHLMVADPEHVGVLFADRGVRRIIGHIEAMGHANDALRILDAWRKYEVETGVSLLLDTSVDEISGIVPHIDVVQIMSIAEIGYQGHAFDERAVEHIAELRANYPDLTIAVDGGVSKENAKELVGAGANRLAVGSAIMKRQNPAEAYKEIQSALQ